MSKEPYNETLTMARRLANALDEQNKLLAENKRLREDLEAYADPSNWEVVDGIYEWVGKGIGPTIASDALQEVSHD